jgi:transposase
MPESRPNYDDLLETIRQLQRQLEALQAENARLRADLEAARRAGKRQAAPFAKGPPKPDPKAPGRKAGDRHGPHGHRPPPPPERVDETHDAPLPGACPHCGGSVAETHVDRQYQTDLPRRPVVRQFDVHCGRCRGCGRPCRGRHPLQTSDAVGAAASQLGPDAQAAVALLNKDAGLSHGKVAAAFAALFGITLTRGACAQIVLRAGRRLRPAYAEVRQRLPASPAITADETGWRVGGRPAWLHAWVGDDLTCYVISPHRSADALAGAIGIDWAGVLVHDGFASYDRFEAACHQQCLAHVLRRAHDLGPTQPGAARRFPRQVIELFQGALAVRDAYVAGEGDATLLEVAHERYVGDLHALTERPRANAANDALARHLWVHGEQWFQFLTDPSIPATNYRAEQALRPAVVNRKVWGGNRTEAGAEAQGIVSSVLQTCRQRLVSAFDYVRDTLCHGFTSLFTPATVAGR